MAYENLLVDRDQGIVTISFNRPKALNALNSALLDELSRELNKITSDEQVRALVLTGTGDKAFIAGADITELGGLNALQAKQFAQEGQAVFNQIATLPVTVIAAVNGYALGGGLEIALVCDFIYAAETAIFGLPEINLGLIPGFGGTQRLPRLIGVNLARELIFTGKMIPATEAQTLGIVNRVLDVKDLMPETMATAQTIAQKGRVALRAAKQAIANGLNTDLNTGLCIEQDAFALCIASPDAKEGTTAFLEKRKPVFKGKLDR